MKKLVTLLIVLAVSAAMAASFTVDPDNAVIVAAPEAGAVARLAAAELQYYLQLMTGKKIAIVPKAVPGK